MTTTLRLTAIPIYPDTGTFPYLFLIQEEEEDDDFLTAYGLVLLSRPLDEACDFCDGDRPDARVEYGATGAPDVGVPVHLKCILERGGSVWNTADVHLAALCSANVGGDPANGCENFAEPASDYCAAHSADIDASSLSLAKLNAALPDGCVADWAHSPSVFTVALPNTTACVYLTTHLNREDGGWEAVLDRDGDQDGLPDGPLVTAPAAEVVTWATAVTAEALSLL